VIEACELKVYNTRAAVPFLEAGERGRYTPAS
jgi:hypothetical protein